MDTLFILENDTIGSWYVGKLKMKKGLDTWPIYRSLTQDQLNDKLYKKCTEYDNPYVHLVFLNEKWRVCYGIERWLSNLEKKNKREPEKYKYIKELLTAGWYEHENTPYSTIYVINVPENVTSSVYDDLKKNWGNPNEKSSKLRSTHTLKTCLNVTRLTRKERYEKNKQKSNFLKEQAQRNILYRMSKGYVPKCKTLEKYNLSNPNQIQKID